MPLRPATAPAWALRVLDDAGLHAAMLHAAAGTVIRWVIHPVRAQLNGGISERSAPPAPLKSPPRWALQATRPNRGLSDLADKPLESPISSPSEL